MTKTYLVANEFAYADPTLFGSWTLTDQNVRVDYDGVMFIECTLKSTTEPHRIVAVRSHMIYQELRDRDC